MTVIWILLTVILAALALWAVCAWQPLGKNRALEHFPHLIRSLLIGMENSSAITFRHRDSEMYFQVRRDSGSGEDAILVLTIPRASWSERSASAIRERIESNSFDYRERENESELLGEVHIPVANIWDDAAGAPCSHAARLLLDSLGLPKSARFDVTQSGLASRRIADRYGRSAES